MHDTAKTHVPMRKIDSELLLLRAEKFCALAALFRTDVSQYPHAIEKLLTPCPGIAECAAGSLAACETGRAALQWATDRPDRTEIMDEHLSLFGSDDLITCMPQVAPCANMYVGGDSVETAIGVSALYDSMGFCGTVTGRCSTRMDVELEFTGHLLREASEGDIDALLVARGFIVTHLFTWGVVFSAATFSRSNHPITRFAGLMLEHMLFCETEQAKSLARGYRVLDTHPESGSNSAYA